MPIHLQVCVSGKLSPDAHAAGQAAGADCRVVGESRALGSWDPKQSPKLQLKEKAGSLIFEGTLADDVAAPGTEFKYCILNLASHQYAWETKGPLHKMPKPGPKLSKHFFEDAASDTIMGDAEVPHLDKKQKVMLESDKETCGTPGKTIDFWIPWASPKCSSIDSPPRTIFHAFNWSFQKVMGKLDELSKLGFSAIQLSPAQKSKSGNQWWARYQPKDYTKIEGLGTIEELRELCQRASALGLTIIADVVFNHMLVVAGADEWEKAQQDEVQLKKLQNRLSKEVGPALSAEDFQWPWFKLAEHHWDNWSRYEGWGNGEWSELRFCPKVVGVHKQHLNMLMDAGVKGFRFDAVKHMRTEHISAYMKILSEAQPVPFSYGEVLSVDYTMHAEYMEPCKLPMTDFPLTVYLKRSLCNGFEVAKAGVSASAKEVAPKLVDISTQPPADRSAPLSSDSIRFARNHDTVMNDFPFAGLVDTCATARLVWVWLLAVHDGSVLIFDQDVFHADSAGLLQRAVQYRARVGPKAVKSEVCLRFRESRDRPELLVVTLRSPEGSVVGICLANVQSTPLIVTQIPVVADLSGVEELVMENGSKLNMRANGEFLSDTGSALELSIPPEDAIFLRSKSVP